MPRAGESRSNSCLLFQRDPLRTGRIGLPAARSPGAADRLNSAILITADRERLTITRTEAGRRDQPMTKDRVKTGLAQVPRAGEQMLRYSLNIQQGRAQTLNRQNRRHKGRGI